MTEGATARRLLADRDRATGADPEVLLPLVRDLLKKDLLDGDIGVAARGYEVAYRSSPEVFCEGGAATRRWLLDLHAARLWGGPSPDSAASWRLEWVAGVQANRGLQSPWRNLTGVATTLTTASWQDRAVAAVGYEDGSARVWDLSRDLPLGRPILFAERIGADDYALAVGDVDGRLVVVTVGYDGAGLWDVQTGDQERFGPRRLYSVAVGRVGRRPVVVMGGESAVHVWDLRRRRPVHGLRLVGHHGRVHAVALTTVGGMSAVVSAGEDGTVRVWDLHTGRPLGKPLTGPADGSAALAAGCADGRPLAVSAGADGVIRLWDLADSRPSGSPLTGHEGPVAALDLVRIQGRQMVMSGGHDGTVRLWDLRSRRQFGVPLAVGGGPVWSLAATQVRGRPVALVGTRDAARVGLWDLATRTRREWAPAGRAPVVALATGHGPNGPTVMSFPDCPRSPGRQIIDTSTGRPGNGFAIELGDRAIRAAAIGRLGLHPVAITGDAGGTLRLWGIDGAGHPPRSAPLTGHQGQVLTVVMCHLGADTFAVSGGEDGTVRVWNLRTHTAGEPLVGHAGPVTSIAVVGVGPGAVVVSGGEDGTVRRWDLLTNAAIGHPLGGHAGAVRAVAAGILDGRPAAASAGDDGTVRLWDLRSGRQVGQALRGHDGPVSAIVLVRRGRHTTVVSGGHDGTVRVWDGWTSRRATVVFPWPIGALQWTAAGRLVVAYGSETAALTPRFDHH